MFSKLLKSKMYNSMNFDPWGLSGKEFACCARDSGSVSGSERCPGKETGNPTPVFLPVKSHGQRAWQATVHGVAKELDTT